MLQSPNFVYRTELGANAAPLSNFEIASKLSFLLRDTTPDDALLDAAERGELGTTDAVVQRAQAILDGMEAVPVLARYHSELFGLDRFETIDKDRMAFPNYNPTMNAALMEGDRMFFDRVFQSGLGVREVLLSSVAFVNSSTAPFYAATASGSGLTQVTVGPERPGFFTRIGFLAYNGNLREPDPIHRGVDIMHRLLCSTLAPPPGEIPPLPAVMPGQTNRQRVEAHTGDGVCAGCHVTLINPLGFALENFDALGQLRTMDNGQAVNTAASYELSSGITPFSGAPELMQILAGSPEAHACYARRLGEYALARDAAEADRGLVNELTTASMTDTGSLKAMLTAAVRSPLFTVRTGGTL
jgi:hypothetical protein